MITIGIIDDVSDEVDNIRATIFTTWQKLPDVNSSVEFKVYTLENSTDFKEKLINEILLDVDEKNIQGLVVDYKLDSLRKVVKGKEIVTFIKETVPEFPVIILTNAPEPSRREQEIDPDKVYAKYDFFNIGSKESNELCFNIYLNIQRYIKRRYELENELSITLDELTSRKDADVDVQLIAKISNIEYKLSDYVVFDQPKEEKSSDLSELKEIIADITKLEETINQNR